MRAVVVGLVAVAALGCTEGAKTDPLARVASKNGPVRKVEPKAAPKDDPVKPPVTPVAPKSATTLYAKLGEEKGLLDIAQRTIDELAKDPKTKDVADKLMKQNLANFLMEATSLPKILEELPLTAAEWPALLVALRRHLVAPDLGEVERDELLTRIREASPS